MLLSIGLIVLVSLSLAGIFHQLRIPAVLSMILTGILLGPYVLNLIDPTILSVSGDLRKIALIIILIRAGLSLDLKDLKKVGISTLLLSFLPSTFEIIVFAVLGPALFGLTFAESLMLGAIVAAVSPAIVVPKMLHMIEKKEGTEKRIPQMILAAASVDDIYVILLFTIFVQINQQGAFSAISFLVLPISLILGLIIGVACGWILVLLFKKIHIRDTIKVFLILGFAFVLVALEEVVKPFVSFSALLAVMAMGITILAKHPVVASRLTSKFSKIWIGAEILLFVLVGAAVQLSLLTQVGLVAIGMILLSLTARMIAVAVSTSSSGLSIKERFFVAVSYVPKATVQAAIGSVPLSLGLASGNLMLAIAVLAILVTAPLGTFLINIMGKRLYQDPLANLEEKI